MAPLSDIFGKIGTVVRRGPLLNYPKIAAILAYAILIYVKPERSCTWPTIFSGLGKFHLLYADFGLTAVVKTYAGAQIKK